MAVNGANDNRNNTGGVNMVPDKVRMALKNIIIKQFQHSVFFESLLVCWRDERMSRVFSFLVEMLFLCSDTLGIDLVVVGLEPR